MATKKRTTTKKAGSTKRTTKAAKKTTAGKPKKLSQIDAAIKVLGQARKPMMHSFGVRRLVAAFIFKTG